MWKCNIDGEYFASERAFIDHMVKKHEQNALDRWLQGDIFDE
jgi:hypothetical protein